MNWIMNLVISLFIFINISLFASDSNKTSDETAKKAAIKIFKKSDIASLSVENKKKIISLITNIISTNQKENYASYQAINYIKRKGYKICYLEITDIDSKKWLLVATDTKIYMTKRFPFPSSSFRRGFYFCKKNSFRRGISKMLDNEGIVVDFFFSSWKEFDE